MTTSEVKEFIEIMLPVIVTAGRESVKAQKSIVNVGKDVEKFEGEPELELLQREAKTEMDDYVQELLLSQLKKAFGTQKFAIDAEENTPTKNDFTKSSKDCIVVIDPIDGTYEYKHGKDEFSINVGIIEKGKILSTIVFFPSKKLLYLLDEKKTSYLITLDPQYSEIKKEFLQNSNEQHTNKIFLNSRVSENSKKKLKKFGFELIEDKGEVLWPEAFRNCISGEYDACVFHTPQVRDVLLGAFIESFPDGCLLNWKGRNQKWPQGGRFETGIFGRKKVDSKIINALAY